MAKPLAGHFEMHDIIAAQADTHVATVRTGILLSLQMVVFAAIGGRLGTVPLAAVGLSNLVFFFCTVFFSFLLVVTTPRVASAVANEDLNEVLTQLSLCSWCLQLCF